MICLLEHINCTSKQIFKLFVCSAQACRALSSFVPERVPLHIWLCPRAPFSCYCYPSFFAREITMAKIFLSYRREDSGGYARAIQDRLMKELGADVVFMDVDGIPIG